MKRTLVLLVRLMNNVTNRLNESIRVSVPGRVCMHGEHQDFLGLSVIAMAIDLYFVIKAWPRDDNKFVIHMPDLPETDELVPSEALEYRHHRDYVPACINVLKRRGIGFDKGYDFVFASTIPVNAGVSSSSAMCVGWAKTLLALAGDPAAGDAAEVAKIAHQTEVLEFNEPGGTMDHYTTSVGGLVYIDCVDPIEVTPIDFDLTGFVLGNSLEKKDTKGTLRASRQAVEAGIAEMAKRIPDFSLRETPAGCILAELAALPDEMADKLRANVINRDLCQEARRMLESGPLDRARFGAMLDEHHAQLRDGLGISTPKLESLIAGCKQAGALGGKLNGSGGGGTMIAYAPGREAEAAAAIDARGGKGYVIRKSRGAIIEFKAEGL
ncbi:MAG: galactokinase family protein [Planctomycetota bacterium]